MVQPKTNKREICEFDGCSRNAKYAIYQFRPDGTKVWGYFCDEHENDVFEENQRLLKNIQRPSGTPTPPLLANIRR